MWVIFADMLICLALIGYGLSQAWHKYQGRKEWNRLYRLKHYSIYGYLTIGEATYTTQLLDSYTVDSQGNSYTHIGGGGEIRIPHIKMIKVFPGQSIGCFANNPLFLHCHPNRVKPLDVISGFGVVEYVIDSDGKKYFIRWDREK